MSDARLREPAGVVGGPSSGAQSLAIADVARRRRAESISRARSAAATPSAGARIFSLSHPCASPATTRQRAAPVLVTTDVGARGLDIRQLPAVVSFDVPASIEQYVHRAGRTGRQGAAGVALTLLRRDAASAAFARGAVALLQAGGVDVPAELAALAS